MSGGLGLALGAPLLASPVATQPASPYRNDSAWLCLPGRADVCSTPLATTALEPNGYGPTGRSAVAADPPLDCFYLYPTVSRDRGLNSDRLAGPEERSAVQAQFARFAGVCRPFAPIYRQMTVSSVVAAIAGSDVNGPAAIAYGDVAAAWRDYLRHRNRGRPFVLVGHSQGSLMLRELIAREIEGRPEQAQLRLAILAGYNVLVPQGRLVGGSFRSTPLCSRVGQVGCVVAWTSYREGNPPPPGALFGHAERPGMTVACVNPARPGSRQWERLDSYWPARPSYPVAGGPIVWSSEGPPPTPFLRTEGLASGRCVNDSQRGYLAIRTNSDPSDRRTDRIGGEVGMMGLFLPGWGMHMADIDLVLGDLLRLVAAAGR